MIDLKEAQLKAVAAHKVGNKVRNEDSLASQELIALEDPLRLALQDFFFPPFKHEAFYRFAHEGELIDHPVYRACHTIFNSIGTSELLEQSIELLHHLHDVSIHPKIKSGEFFVAMIEDCLLEGVSTKAIGIFKAEHKDIFLKVKPEPDYLQVLAEEGISIKKLDKGCIVFNTFAEDGYSILLVDKESEESHYWREEFLQLVRLQDDSYQTEMFLDMTHEFCQDVFGQEEEKKDQLVFMNKSINYFNDHQEFDLVDFQQEVITKPEYVDKFNEFRNTYEGELGLSSEGGFAISKYAVRNKKRDFKNLIRLDTQIEIFIKNKDTEEAAQYLEKGYDEQRDMNYYKVYFRREEDA